MRYLCDSCANEGSAPYSHYIDSDGVERRVMREYALCRDTSRPWVVEKRPEFEHCGGYIPAGGKKKRKKGKDSGKGEKGR